MHGQVTRVTDAGEGELSARRKNAGKDTAGRDDAGSGDKAVKRRTTRTAVKNQVTRTSS